MQSLGDQMVSALRALLGPAFRVSSGGLITVHWRGRLLSNLAFTELLESPSDEALVNKLAGVAHTCMNTLQDDLITGLWYEGDEAALVETLKAARVEVEICGAEVWPCLELPDKRIPLLPLTLPAAESAVPGGPPSS